MTFSLDGNIHREVKIPGAGDARQGGKGINSAIRLNSHRTQKKDESREGWIKLRESKERWEGKN